jgi:CoA-transferase family III
MRLLAEAWGATAGVEGLPMPAELEVTGEPGQLPSLLPVEDTAIACAGSALLAAVAFRSRRGGPGAAPGAAPGAGAGSVRLDRSQVAAAFRSERYLRVNDQPFGDGFAPLSRFWQASDGWVRTHANYPWHRAALLRALGCPGEVEGEAEGEAEAVAAAIAGCRALDLAELVVAAGGIAAAVRSPAEWAASPQGQAGPLVSGGRIDDAPARHRAPSALPAEGIRVLDLTRVIAGPVATRYLAALGADVLRIDPPAYPELPLHAVDGLLGKRSALADFGTRDGLRILHELLDGADVLVHGYRPHALDRFGLAPAVIAERHPGLVVVTLSAWGDSGPWGDRRGFDSIVQAATGIALAESDDGERPGVLPCQLLDHGTGYLCAAAALGSLAAQLSGGGTHVRSLSLARTSTWLLSQPQVAHDVAAVTSDPRLCVVESADGPVTTVDPPGELDGAGLRWRRPLTRYGSDPLAWGVLDRDQRKVGQTHDVPGAAQPDRQVVVGLLLGCRRQRMILVARQPLLHVSHVAGLEVIPLVLAGRLDPLRPESRADGEIDQPGEFVVVIGGDAWPHGHDFRGCRRMLPEAFAEEHAASRIDQATQREQRILAVLRGLSLAEGMACAEAQDQIGGPLSGGGGPLGEQDPLG